MAVRPFLNGLIGTSILMLTVAVFVPAQAQTTGREAQIVIDAQTNEVLYENNAQALRRPASITKVMTLYLLFDALKQGSISWDDRIVFSRNASNQPPTKLSVAPGNSIPVQTAVEALVLRSANDVATAVAERLGGSETNFAVMMTNKARELGMSSTTFRNASGLPNETQRSTAEDLARLAIAIQRDFPDQYYWFSASQMSWNGQIITGHNHLMSRMQGMDGLKTGYTRASGFNLAATTQRNGRRIVTVVLGGVNRFVRDDLVEALTESAFREIGISATQFASNTTSYDVNFRDARDAADAAALFMDLPPPRQASAYTSSIAMVRNGRRIGFERGAPAFQVADMTRAPSQGSTGRTSSQNEDLDSGATDEGETEVGRVAPRPATVATPFRVAVAPSAQPVPVRFVQPTPRSPVPVPVPVLVRVPVPTPVPSPVPAPVPAPVRVTAPETRQLAELGTKAAPAPQATEVAPVTTPIPTPLRQLAQLETSLPPTAPTKTDPLQSAEAAPATLRGTIDAATSQLASAEVPDVAPNAPQTNVVPTQMAQLETPAPSVSQPPTDTSEAAPPQTAQAEPAVQPAVQETQLTQMAELSKQDAAALATSSPPAASTSELNGSINLAEAAPVASSAPGDAASAPQTAPAQNVQMAALNSDAVAQAQVRQAEANEREQARMAEAQAIENTRREAARVQAAAAARVLAERQANERRAERQLAEVRAKALKEKEARDALLAERQAAQERAVAARNEERRQGENTRARNARGTAVVQVGAFKDKADANAAINQFASFFPTFAQREVSSISRRDGVWYRARFAGLGTVAAREACRLVSGRGGACAIVGD
jgi:D-alanyl-D-alanine carboxypeptidase